MGHRNSHEHLQRPRDNIEYPPGKPGKVCAPGPRSIDNPVASERPERSVNTHNAVGCLPNTCDPTANDDASAKTASSLCERNRRQRGHSLSIIRRPTSTDDMRSNPWRKGLDVSCVDQASVDAIRSLALTALSEYGKRLWRLSEGKMTATKKSRRTPQLFSKRRPSRNCLSCQGQLTGITALLAHTTSACPRSPTGKRPCFEQEGIDARTR
jgi:hypothetical protein